MNQTTPTTSDAIAPSDSALAQSFRDFAITHFNGDGDAFAAAVYERAREIAAQPGEGGVWRNAVLDQLAITSMDAALTEPPHKIIGRIIDWHVAVATDPAMNGGLSLQSAVPMTERMGDMPAEWQRGYMVGWNARQPAQPHVADALDGERLVRLARWLREQMGHCEGGLEGSWMRWQWDTYRNVLDQIGATAIAARAEAGGSGNG